MKHIGIGVIGGKTTISLCSSFRNGVSYGKSGTGRFGPVRIGAAPSKTTLCIIR